MENLGYFISYLSSKKHKTEKMNKKNAKNTYEFISTGREIFLFIHGQKLFCT